MWPDRTRSLTCPPREALRFGGAWLVLNFLPFVPALATALPVSPYFPLCAEVLVLITGVVYARGTRLAVPARRFAIVAMLLLLVYQAYDAGVYSAFRRHGILYEDLQFLDNLIYFIYDIGTWRVAALGIAGVVGAGGVIWTVQRCVRAIADSGRYGGCRAAVVAVHMVAWPLLIVVGPAQEWGTPVLTYQTTGDQVRFRTITTRAIANGRASLRLEAMLDSLGTAPVDSAYYSYDRVDLESRPPIYMIAVESYGSVLDGHTDLREPYRRVLRRTENVLREDGWHSASAHLRAPVRGGRSWLVIASLLTGVRVDRQLVYNRFKGDPDDVPHLVRFLDNQGYHTVALQPFTFPRPGLPVQNLYDFDVTLYRDDLEYNGPEYGLANAPDQYSLNFAHETELASSEDPFFLFFETVSSHALWNYGLPPYLPDWQEFNGADGPRSKWRARLEEVGAPPTEFLPDSITAPRIFDQPLPERYLQHIAYDLRVIRDYIVEKAPEGSLVLLLGDHQPPLLDSRDNDVPLHVLSTDSSLVHRVQQYGLTDGLRLSDTSTNLRQEGLYSLLVRVLAVDGAPSDSTTRVPYRPDGVSPSLLVR